MAVYSRSIFNLPLALITENSVNCPNKKKIFHLMRNRFYEVLFESAYSPKIRRAYSARQFTLSGFFVQKGWRIRPIFRVIEKLGESASEQIKNGSTVIIIIFVSLFIVLSQSGTPATGGHIANAEERTIDLQIRKIR